MAVDTATKRRSALGVSSWILPAADSDVDSTDRALLLRAYILAVDAVTPTFRTFDIAVELRVKVTP